ncbi:MAG: tetratricopeptide repeat protein [Bacteroidales bacterium]|nr:tetratricopeptide repeat protein [Bacteroidales bacterium]
MAKIEAKDQEMIQQEKLEQTISKTEKFFEENKKYIYGAVIAAIAIAAIVLCFQKFYVQPKKAEALGQLFPAEANFRAQNYELALKGDSNVLGFEQILDEYGSKAGSVVNFYAGVCELNLGNFNEAISYLKKYKGTDKILVARSLACIGDAYVGLENYKEALNFFEKAARTIDNIYVSTYHLKAGVVCEQLGQNDKALSYYKEIKDKYAQTVEGYDIDKYITRVENK